MKVALVLTALLALATLVSSQAETYCGRRLASALAYFCDNNWVKRDPYAALAWGSIPQYSALGVGSIPQHSALGVGSIPMHSALGVGRSKRQVVSECCDKPCSRDELLAYCYY